MQNLTHRPNLSSPGLLALALAAVALTALISDCTHGQAVNSMQFIGPNGGAWTDAGNWLDQLNNNTAPGTTSIVTIDNGATAIYTESPSFASSVLSLTVGASSGLTLTGESSLQMLGATGFPNLTFFINRGTITLENGSASELTRIILPTVGLREFDEGGTIALHGNHTAIVGSFVNMNHTIRGSGQLGLSAHTIDNRGTIVADRVGETMTIRPGFGSFGLRNNGGSLGASGGGHLALVGGAGRFDNAGGSIHATGAGSVVSLSAGAVIENGTLNGSGGGIFRSVASSDVFMNSVTIAPGAHLLIEEGTTPSLDTRHFFTGTNNGLITVGTDATGPQRALLHGFQAGNQPLVLTGSGTVRLASDFASVGGLLFGNTEQAAGHSIRGFGTVANSLFNSGTVAADVTGRMLRVNTSTFIETNNGILEATNGGILRIGGGQNNQSASGITRALGAGSVVEVQNSGGFNGGRVETSGGGQIRAGGVPSDFTRLVDVTLDADFVVTPRTRLLPGGTVTNNGTITLKPSNVANTGTDVEWQGNATLTGTGELVLESNANGQSRIFTNTVAPAVHGANHTIRGNGLMIVNGLFDNQGVIRSDVTGQTLAISASSVGSAYRNANLTESTNGATLSIGGVHEQQPGGITRANGIGSLLNIANGTNFSGGTLAAINGGLIRQNGISSSLINNTTIQGPFELESATLRVTSSLTNNGTITLLPGTISNSLINLETGATLGGSGEVVLVSSPARQSWIFTNSAATTRNGAGHTIRGEGLIRVTGPFINEGVIRADVAGASLFVGTFGNPSSIQNTGSFQATNGGTLQVYTTPTNFTAGTLTDGQYEVHAGSSMQLVGVNIANNAAEILLDGAGSNLYNAATGTTSALAPLASNAGQLTIRNGRDLSTTGNLSNSGVLIVGDNSTLTVNGTLSNSGKLGGTGRIVAGTSFAENGSRLTPGNSPGTLTFEGDLVIGDGAIYEWELGQFAADLIQVNGNLTFNATATLDVLHFGSGLPIGGDYVLFSSTGSIGSLPNWTINLPTGWTASGIAVQGQNVVLQSLVAVPEPSMLSLILAIAGGGMMLRRRSVSPSQSI